MLSDSSVQNENLVIQFLGSIQYPNLFYRLIGFFGICREDINKRTCQPGIHWSFKTNIFTLIGDRFIIPFFISALLMFFSDRTPENLYFLSRQGFFSTGHQCLLGSLHFEASYFLGSYHQFLSPIFVFLNTFICFIISAFFSKDILKLLSYHTYTLICINIFCIYGRHHLQIWQVFTPKLMFETVETVICLIVALIRKFLK